MAPTRSAFDNLPDLVQLYPIGGRPDNVEVDIIAIHGLGSNPLTTWVGKRKDNAGNTIKEVSWLSDNDMLPAIIPKARVWSFRYDSRWLGTSPIQRLPTLAEKLRVLMEERIPTTQGKKVPIVWVCHSFGGLILEQLIVDANLHLPPQHVVESTTGMIFLGTPFGGSDSTGMALNVVAAARVLGYDAHKELLEYLQPKSNDLFDLRYRFELISRQMDFKIVCFFEQLPTSYFRIPGLSRFKREIIVPEQHAYIGGATKYPLSKSHRDLNEYDGPDDVNFKSVVGRIAAIVKDSPSILQQRSGVVLPAPSEVVKPSSFFMVPYFRNSNFCGRGDLLAELDSRLIYQEGFHSRVALYGLGGVGKSQIATEYLYRFHKRSPEISIFWVHAATRARFEQSYLSIAQLAGINFSADQDEDKLARTSAWLESVDSGKWLLVIDNADDRDVMMSHDQGSGDVLNVEFDLMHYIPAVSHGLVLFTTRKRSLGYDLADGKIVEVPRLEANDCEHLLSNMLSEKTASKEDLQELIEAMERLPLALVQAASFMAKNSETVRNYLEIFNGSKASQIELLDKQFKDLGRRAIDKKLGDTPRTILTTWVVSFKRIQQEDPLAATILKVMSFYEKQDVPRELLPREDASDIQFTESIGTLQAYSLISPSLTEKAFDMHRLVQVATGKYLDDVKETAKWAAVAVQMVADNFPDPEPETWSKCARYLPHAQSVIQAFQNVIKDDRVGIQLLIRVGEYRHYRGHQQAAAELFHKAVELADAFVGPDDELTLEAQGALALAWNDMGKFNEAFELGSKIVETRKRLFGEESADLLQVQNNLALTLHALARYDEALELQRHVLDLQTKILGPEDTNTISSEGNIAYTLWSLGRIDEAREIEESVVAKRKRLLGENHPHYLTSLNNLALSYHNLGLWKEAEKLELEVLERRTTVLGAEHPDTLSAANNLALTYQSLGRLEEAEKLEKEVVEAQKRLIGATHPDTLSAMGNLAFNWWLQERFDEAEELEKFVLDARNKDAGEDHPSALLANHNYSGTLRSCGRLDEAEALGERTLEKLRKVLGNEHNLTLQSMLEVAVVYWDKGELEKAFALEKEAADTFVRKFGADHPDSLMARNNLAYTYFSLGDRKTAMEMMKDVIKLRTEKLGPQHAQTLQSIDSLASWEAEIAEEEAQTSPELKPPSRSETTDSDDVSRHLSIPGGDHADPSSEGSVSGEESGELTDVEGETSDTREQRLSRRRRKNRERRRRQRSRRRHERAEEATAAPEPQLQEPQSSIKVEVEEFVPQPLAKRRTFRDPPEAKSISKQANK